MAAPDAAQVLETAANYEALLVGLTETNNDTRSAAEALFERCKAHPEALIAQTVRCLRTSGRSDMRDLSAVLLRKARPSAPPAGRRPAALTLGGARSCSPARARSGRSCLPPLRRA